MEIIEKVRKMAEDALAAGVCLDPEDLLALIGESPFATLGAALHRFADEDRRQKDDLAAVERI